METDKQYDFQSLCLHFGLGNLLEKPIAINGGLLHKMLKVHTDQACYAIKCLNPAIMSRETALSNMINSEKIAEVLKENIPAITARKINGAHVHHYEGHYYMFFDWFDGTSIYPPHIRVLCQVLGCGSFGTHPTLDFRTILMFRFHNRCFYAQQINLCVNRHFSY